MRLSFPAQEAGYRCLMRRPDWAQRMTDSGFELTVGAIGGVLAVAVLGPVTRESHEPLRECLDSAIRGGRPVVLDLSDAELIDDASIAMLMDAHRRLATRLRLVADRGGAVHAAFRQAGVSHVLALHASRAEAMAAAAG
jgi:anti-sigma B factor antagonist